MKKGILKIFVIIFCVSLLNNEVKSMNSELPCSCGAASNNTETDDEFLAAEGNDLKQHADPLAFSEKQRQASSHSDSSEGIKIQEQKSSGSCTQQNVSEQQDKSEKRGSFFNIKREEILSYQQEWKKRWELRHGEGSWQRDCALAEKRYREVQMRVYGKKVD